MARSNGRRRHVDARPASPDSGKGAGRARGEKRPCAQQRADEDRRRAGEKARMRARLQRLVGEKEPERVGRAPRACRHRARAKITTVRLGSGAQPASRRWPHVRAVESEDWHACVRLLNSAAAAKRRPGKARVCVRLAKSGRRSAWGRARCVVRSRATAKRRAARDTAALLPRRRRVARCCSPQCSPAASRGRPCHGRAKSDEVVPTRSTSREHHHA